MAKNTTINQELVNKLSNIIKAYDPYTAYIEDYKQYSNAVECNCELDQQFIHTCKEYGYDVKVSFCYSLAESLASDKFDSAEDVVIDYLNSLTKEDDTMKQQNNVATNNSTTVEKEETTMERTTLELLNDALNIKRIQDDKYVTNDMLRAEYQKLTGEVIGAKKNRSYIISMLQEYLIDDAKVDTEDDNTVDIGDFCRDKTPESIEEESASENPATVSDAKAKTIEVLNLIKTASSDNKNRGFGTTVSAYMLCAYILQAGYGIKKLKGHEAEITDEQKDTVKKVRQWLIDKGYIKVCVYKTNDKSVYTDDYDGNHADSMIHHSKSLGLTCVGVSSYKVTF